MNIRPVRLAPCAAGASPTISSRGFGDPKLGTGRPQYGWSAKARRLDSATSSRQPTSRGHARHTLTIASSSGIEPARALRAATWAAVVGHRGLWRRRVAGPSGAGDDRGRELLAGAWVGEHMNIEAFDGHGFADSG